VDAANYDSGFRSVEEQIVVRGRREFLPIVDLPVEAFVKGASTQGPSFEA
jgi:hypothetical protein